MKRDMIEIGTSVLGGLGIGAMMMYLFDPDRGARRRRDFGRQAGQMVSGAGMTLRRAGDEARHMRDTASSYLHRGKSSLEQTRASLMHKAESCPAMKVGRIGAPILGGLMLGAGLMFLLDPASGRRRRARVRDKARHYVHEAGDTLASRGRDWSHRAKGMMHEAKKSVMGGHHNGGHRLGAVEEQGQSIR